jgi:hypothetical protein
MEVSGQLQAPVALTEGKEPVAAWKGHWVDPRTALYDVEKREF